ncbi:MAG: outer membrane beta-barrel protein [Alistipes sp.]|nr:outer membrane beta-barrel protein [Alistipes sp.]
MKKLLVLIVALMASLTLSAQEMRYGVTGGVNFAWMHNPISSSDAYIGFNAGVKAEMDLSSVVADGFYADARALYSLKGGRWSGIHQNLGYLELPFNFGYRIDTGSDVGVLVGLGPYFGLGVLGKNVVKADGAKVKSDLFGDSYKRFDFGLNYNVGVELWSQWQFFVGFEHSLLNIAKSSMDGEGDIKVRPLNFYIGTAFMF